MEYPMIVALVTSGKRVTFPDFPGCLVTCSHKQLTTLGPNRSEAAFIRKVATDYLSLWIQNRLSKGFKIARPRSYDLPSIKNNEELWELELPDELEDPLQLNWMRQDLGWDAQRMSEVLGFELDRYREIETGKSLTTQDESDRIRALKNWFDNEDRAAAS